MEILAEEPKIKLYLTEQQWKAFEQLGYDMSRCRIALDSESVSSVADQKDAMRKHLGFSAWAFSPLWD